MSDSNRKFSFQGFHEYMVLRMQKENAYPIMVSDWDYLKKKVEQIQLLGALWYSIGSALLGIAGTAIVGALTLTEAASKIGRPVEAVCWAIGMASLVCGSLTFCFAHRVGKQSGRSKADVLAEMERLESKFEPVIPFEDMSVWGDLVVIPAPMVGTFYRAPAPGAQPYVRIGDEIGSNQVICIIEAMKLMNEIASGVSGVVVEIFVEDGQPVEYDQPLFRVELRPSGGSKDAYSNERGSLENGAASLELTKYTAP
jgi:biotin carboxyl carrier protein